MYSLLIACCLIAACSAATRPVIPGTFEALTTVEIHRGRTAEFGKGYYYSDEQSMKKVRNDTLETGDDKGEYFFLLEDYEEKKVFHIRPDGHREECTNEPTRGDYEAPFSWVKTAKYNGTEKIREREYDVWYLKEGDLDVAVAVDPDTPNVPVILMQRSVGENRYATFTKFDATTPPSTAFAVPRQCRERRPY